MRTLVTGAAGFVGRGLVAALTRRGEELSLICHPNADTRGFDPHRVRIHWGDILDTGTVREAIRGCDRVFHLAAYARNWAPDPQVFYRNNVQGLVNVLEAASRDSVRKVVFTSSCVTLGPSNGRPVDEYSPRLRDPYTLYERSKIIAEDEACRATASGLPVVIVNPTRVFGPGPLSEANSVTRLIHLYVDGRWHFILGDGSAVGNYAFIDDVVDGHIRAMDAGRPGERYLLGGENISLNLLLQRIARISGRSRRLFSVPAPVALGFGWLEGRRARWLHSYPTISVEWVRAFLDNWSSSCTKAERELGYRVTPLDVGLARTIAWLASKDDARTGAR